MSLSAIRTVFSPSMVLAQHVLYCPHVAMLRCQRRAEVSPTTAAVDRSAQSMATKADGISDTNHDSLTRIP